MPVFNYDPAVSTDKDWVRRTIGDIDSSNFEFYDEEITAFLTNSDNRHFAAADALEAMYVKWLGSGKGVMEKKVENLWVKLGFEDRASQSIERIIDNLRKEGARLLLASGSTRPTVLQML